jgi:hypothetical protein
MRGFFDRREGKEGFLRLLGCLKDDDYSSLVIKIALMPRAFAPW